MQALYIIHIVIYFIRIRSCALGRKVCNYVFLIILSSKKALLNPLAESGFDVLGSTVFSIKLPNQSLKESLGFVLKNISHFPHSERHQNVFKQLEAAASQPPRSAQTKMRYIR